MSVNLLLRLGNTMFKHDRCRINYLYCDNANMIIFLLDYASKCSTSSNEVSIVDNITCATKQLTKI